MYPEQVLTCGEYATEPDSVAALLAIINRDHWLVRQEVRGWLLQPRMDTEGSGNPRIDMILQPTRLLMEAGWRYGMVGIECKRSGVKLGRVISQAMDYTRCVWEMPSGIDVMTRMVFIWPCDNVKSDIESVMIQHRIGVACPRHRGGRLLLRVGETVAYEDLGPGLGARIADVIPGGRKRGSR